MDKKVLLIGDYCQDQYISCDVNRVNPEAATLIGEFKQTKIIDGMVGNILNNLYSLDNSLNITMIATSESVKTRFIDNRNNQQIFRFDMDDKLYKNEKDRKLRSQGEYQKEYDLVIISDYNKNKQNLINTIIEKVPSVDGKTIPVIVNSKNPNVLKDIFEILDYKNYYPKILQVNEKEYSLLKDEYIYYLDKKIKAYDYLIKTVGDKGIELYANCSDKPIFRYKANKVEVVDCCGCGDTALAGVCMFLVNNGYTYDNLEKSIKFANVCGANVVQKKGTSVVPFTEVKDEYNKIMENEK